MIPYTPSTFGLSIVNLFDALSMLPTGLEGASKSL